MKKYLPLILLALLSVSCMENYLDQESEESNTMEKVFASRTETIEWFNKLYSPAMDYSRLGFFMNELEQCQYNHPYMWATDDADVYLDWHVVKWYKGTVNPSQWDKTTGQNGYDIDPFQRYYRGIRHASLFLENVDKCKDQLSESEYLRMKAEAKFMRAVYHWWILRNNGPIPIVQSSVAVADAGVKVGRNTMQECVDWLCSQYDSVYNDPGMLSERSTSDYGFPTKSAVLSMKARLLLYAASPLYNGNSVYANWKNPDGTVLIDPVYNAEKWKLAAEAAKAAIDEAHAEGKALVYPVGYPDCTFDDYVNNIIDLTTSWNSELIWSRPQSCYYYYMNCLPGAFYSWWGGNGVTLELANDFFMADGSKAPELESWFATKKFSSEAGNGTQANTFHMFVNREPRFYAKTFFPNQSVSYATTSNPGVYQTIEYWASGNSGYDNNDGNMNYTGLGVRSHIPRGMQSDRSEGIISWDPAAVPFPVIRLADLYLMYAEAMNEYYGASSHAEILTYINGIRNRSGIASYTGTFTKEEMREMIRQERRVEFAWEDQRFFDVRRWFIAHGDGGAFNTNVHGLNYLKGTGPTDEEFFTMVETPHTRAFRLEHYFYPLNADECAFNSNLVQAPFY